MTTPHRTLQMALDALEWLLANIRRNAPELSGKAMGNAEVAITALREALSAPEPEPVAWKHDCAALCTNDVELWIDACPHCGKPRTAPPAAPAPVVPLQGGMDNNELLAAWQKKLPGKVPEGQELNAFAVGTEVGFEHAQRLERMDWDRVHHVLAKHGKHPGRTDDHLADVIDKALSAAPVPAGWVMVPRGLLRRLIAEALTFDPSLQDKEAIEQAKQLAASPAAPVVREPQPEPVQRLMRFAGKKRSEVSNPCLTAREAIVIADWMQAHGITGASK